MLSSFQVGATTRTDTKRNLYIKDCVFESGQTDKQCRAKNWCHIRTNLKRNLYIKDCIFKSVLLNLIQGTSKHKMHSKKPWFTKTLGKLSNQTQNAIFTLKIAFSGLVNHASLRHQSTSTPSHMNSVDPKKKHPPTSLSAFRLVL